MFLGSRPWRFTRSWAPRRASTGLGHALLFLPCTWPRNSRTKSKATRLKTAEVRRDSQTCSSSSLPTKSPYLLGGSQQVKVLGSENVPSKRKGDIGLIRKVKTNAEPSFYWQSVGLSIGSREILGKQFLHELQALDDSDQSFWQALLNDAETRSLSSVRLTKKASEKVPWLSLQFKTRQNYKAIRNNMLRARGTWTFDWRVPLDILRRQTAVDPDGASLSSEKSHEPKKFSDSPPASVSVERENAKRVLTNKVIAAISQRVPRVLARFVQADGSSKKLKMHKHEYKYIIRDELLALFEDSSAREAFSVDAFTLAIRFFTKDGLMLNHARKILNLMDDVNIKPTAEIFNLFLSVASRRRDLHSFTSWLKIMESREIKPTANTWIHFMWVIESNDVRSRISRVMKDLGMLRDATVVGEIVRPLMDYLFATNLADRSNIDAQTFVDKLDSEYGFSWLTKSSGLEIVRRLCQAGSSHEAMKVVAIMRKRHCKIDWSILVPFIQLCTKACDTRLALEIIERFECEYGVQAQEVCNFLFSLGWVTNSYNICKLCWMVSCVRADTSYDMQDKVFKSLMKNTPIQPQTEKQRWLKQAGKVIMGHEFSGNGASSFRELANRAKVIEAIGWRPMGKERNAALKVAQQLLTEDLSASGRYVYMGNFHKEFREALNKDKLWKQDSYRVAYGNDVQFLTSNAIKPQFTRKTEQEMTVYQTEAAYDEALRSCEYFRQIKWSPVPAQSWSNM